MFPNIDEIDSITRKAIKHDAPKPILYNTRKDICNNYMFTNNKNSCYVQLNVHSHKPNSIEYNKRKQICDNAIIKLQNAVIEHLCEFDQTVKLAVFNNENGKII